MWLISAHDLRMESRDPSTQSYAVLSHTWGDEEVTFQDFQDPDKRPMRGYSKIINCAKQAKDDGIDWVWIDTCCIDKTSSAEFSEAINSMYAWYRDAAVCYAFLEDVPALSPHFPEFEFRKARWFTRGWCLQELIAPQKVEFYAQDWTDIGTKWSLSDMITQITGVPNSLLLHGTDLRDFSIAQKMSWASQRNTSKTEDMAYCLMGIFDVNMPLIYGEGNKAFRRLLSEILKEHDDYSFLLWTTPNPGSKLLAPASFDPGLFRKAGLSIFQDRPCLYGEVEFATGLPKFLAEALERRSPPQLTNRGLQVEMLVHKSPGAFIPADGDQNFLLLFTETICRGKLVCIALERHNGSPNSISYKRAFGQRLFLIEAESLEESYELQRIHLDTTYQNRTSGNKQLHNHKGLCINLSSSCCSTTVDLIGSEPEIQFLGPERTLSHNSSPRSSLECLDFDPTLNSILRTPIHLQLELQQNMSGASERARFEVEIWFNGLTPRCMIILETDDLCELPTATSVGWEPFDSFKEATDRASCWVFDKRHRVVVLVKGCEQRLTLEENRIQERSCYTVHVSLLENPEVCQSISQEQQSLSSTSKRKRKFS